MQTVRIELGARSYPILIGSGLIDQHAVLAEAVSAQDVLVVTSETVGPLYLAALRRGLEGKRVGSVVLADGEPHKTLDSLSRVLDAIVAQRLNRDACVVALGGGVIGDIAGF